jgi:hypothetical protein
MKNIVKKNSIKMALAGAALVVAGAFSLPALAAGNMPTTTVNGLNVINSSTIVVSFGASMTNKPACAQDFERMIVVANTDGGKALFNAIMAAWLSNKHINATGTGTCASGAGLQLETIANINVF